MENNVGHKDQMIRISLGAVTGLASVGILGNFLTQPEFYSPVLGTVSIVLLATGSTGKCGLYERFGINTCKIGYDP